MNKNEILSIEAAVAFSNEIVERQSKVDYPTYRILWKTSFGLATGNMIRYDKYQNPIINESHDNLDYWDKTYTPEASEDLFAVVRHKVIPYFVSDSGFGLKNMILMNKPDMLLDQLLKLSKVEITEDLKIPNYSSILDFKTLDNSVSLPFITLEAAEIESVASLISKS
ncbi:hypothetical protein [Pediococcus stilesii]|uniref:Uncharacterized protein n=1 Tax=Pediococcus stilesii TaxID=331679 RepID=A0A0R2KYS6_9LACO|nr:hypothetical protein [Pediococcus stilesii]KRN94558.1 hypothetical protein IV81_GL001191 [Pediococcus stilesii]